MFLTQLTILNTPKESIRRNVLFQIAFLENKNQQNSQNSNSSEANPKIHLKNIAVLNSGQ
jgi:hypothetical protein